MNKMKRVLSLAIVLTMILGSFGSVFTAVYADADTSTATEELKKVPSDVIGTEYEKAVSRLVAFGVLEGYKDGTYKPAQDVTRAEFAKVLVEALGIGKAASAAKGQSAFKDVPVTHWASGYINVASGEGLLKGFPDGTFQPGKQVSHAEALTMLVRALGYQDSFLKGTWPGSHIAKAAEAGITAGVRFDDASGFANRGNVAQMVNNTLDSDVVKVDVYKDGTTEYRETDKTLLKDKLDISKYEDTRIFADKIVTDGLQKDEVSVRFLKEIKKDDESVKRSYDEGETKDFTVKNGIEPRTLIGEEVSVYMNDRDEMVYIESENDDRANFDYIEEVDGEEISLADLDKDYKFDDDADVYVFNSSDDRYDQFRGKELDSKKIEELELAGKAGKFVIKNNRVIFAEILDSTEADPLFVVMKNDKGVLEGVNKDSEDFTLDLTNDGTYDFALAFDVKGNKMDIKDIEKGNVVYAQLQDYDGDDVAVLRVVTDNKLEGKLGKFREDRVEIDGKFKKVVNYVPVGTDTTVYDAYYTINTLEDIERWRDTDWENDFDDASGESATVYLDGVGRIAFLHTGAESTSGYKYGIVTRTYADGDRVKIFTSLDGKDGEDITFRADKERNLTSPRLITFKDGKFETQAKEGSSQDILGAAVKFRLNRDGEIDENEFYMMDRKAVFTMNADFGKDSMRAIALKGLGEDVNKKYDSATMNDKLTSFSVKDNVSIIDAEGLNTLDKGLLSNGDIEARTDVEVDDFDAVQWKDMKDTKEDKDVRFYVFPRKDKDEEAEGVVFVGSKGANTASDKEAVYVRDRWRSGDDIVIEYISYGSDERKTAIVDGETNLSNVPRRKPYVAEERSNGKIKLYHEADGTVSDRDSYFEFVRAEVEEITGSRITLDGKTYTIDNKAVVYDAGDKKSTSSIRKGEVVVVIVEDNVRVRVVQLDQKLDGGDKPVDEDKAEATVTYVDKANHEIEVEYNNGNVKIFKLSGSARDLVNKVKTGDRVNLEIKGDRLVDITVVKDTKPVEADLKAYNAALAAVKEADYTEASWTAYQVVVKANVVTVKNTQTEVDAATKKIVAAQKDLEEVKPVEGTITGEYVDGLFGKYVEFTMPEGQTKIDSAKLNGNALDASNFDYGVDEGKGKVNVDSSVYKIVVVIGGEEYTIK